MAASCTYLTNSILFCLARAVISAYLAADHGLVVLNSGYNLWQVWRRNWDISVSASVYLCVSSSGRWYWGIRLYTGFPCGLSLISTCCDFMGVNGFICQCAIAYVNITIQLRMDLHSLCPYFRIHFVMLLLHAQALAASGSLAMAAYYLWNLLLFRPHGKGGKRKAKL